MLDKLRKAILVICLGLVSFTVFGQYNTNSPYSMFGIGDLLDGNYGRSASMGGVSTPLFSLNNLNPSNPATYMAIPQSTFVFEVGFTGSHYTLKDSIHTFSKLDGNVRYVAIGFAITKWWKAGVGLNPLSSIGYDIQQSELQILDTDTNAVVSTYSGEGGINSFYFDNSFQIFKSLSVGVKFAYLFGSLDRIRQEESFSRLSTSQYHETNKIIFDAFSFGIGAHFHKNFSENLYLNIGANYNFKTDLNAKDELFSRKLVVKSNGSYTEDTIAYKVNREGIVGVPQKLSIGASVLLNQKLELALDYQNDKWSETKFFGENQNLADNQRYSFGAEFVPDYSSSKYFNIVRYRAGINYTNSYFKFEDNRLKQIGGSLGLGLPLRSGAFVNVGFLYTHRSMADKNFLTEDYFQLNLNFSFKANWFFKSRFE